MARTATKKKSRAAEPFQSGKNAKAHAPPLFRPVQLATLVDAVPVGTGWIHEMKYDGFRTLLAVGGGKARCYTRSGLDWSDRFPGIAAEATKVRVKSALIDGDAVVLDADGRSNFQALQNALKGARKNIDYFAFDLLVVNGEDLTRIPLLDRKARLKTILPAQARQDHGSARAEVRDRSGAAFRNPARALAPPRARGRDRLHGDDQGRHTQAPELPWPA